MIDHDSHDNSFFSKLTNFQNLYKRNYIDRDPVELLFLKNLFKEKKIRRVQVIGGNTCFDLFSTLDSKSEIINYDPFEGYFEKSQKQVDTEKYFFRKYWKFKGKYTHIRKSVKKIENIENCNNDVLMINDNTFFPTFELNHIPSLLIYSHYRELPCINTLITKYVPKIHPLITLRAVSYTMMYFSKNEISNCLPDNMKTHITNGSFGDCQNVKFIIEKKTKKYQNFSEIKNINKNFDHK